MKPQKVDPIRLELPIHEQATEPFDAESVIAMVRSFASTHVRCRKHGAPVGDIEVSIAPGRATIDVTPCCGRAAKDLASHSAESADEEMLTKSLADGKVPPCTAENIRIRTKKLIVEATSLALREGRPLSDYACVVDWDVQVMRVDPARDTRELFVGAGDVPSLVEELDANSGETLLVFIFANDRYDRTMRITGRGYVVGKEGEA